MSWEIKAGLMGKRQSPHTALSSSAADSHAGPTAEREAGTHLLSFFPGIALTLDEYLTARDVGQDLAWPTVRLLAGISKLVRHLHSHGIPMAIATGSRRRNYLLKTGHAEVGEVFELFDIDRNVVCGDPLPEGDVGGRGIRRGRGKPHPDIFLVAARECLGRGVGDVSVDVGGVGEGEKEERGKGLVFEDAVPGVQAAKRAGMSGQSSTLGWRNLLKSRQAVWVPDPNLLALGLDNVVADQVLSSLEEFKPEEWGLPPYGACN